MRRFWGRDGNGTSDEALLAGIAIGDDRAGVVFVRRYQQRLFGLALAILGDAGGAEDVAQEAFIRIFRHAVMYDPRRRAQLGAHHHAQPGHRRASARGATPTDPSDRVFLELMSTERRPEDVALSTDALVPIRAALADLPLDQRRAVVLAAVYGRTGAEIAEAEGIPLGTAKGRLRLGMARLRQATVMEATS